MWLLTGSSNAQWSGLCLLTILFLQHFVSVTKKIKKYKLYKKHTETVTITTSTTNNLHVVWLYGTSGVVDSSNIKITCSVQYLLKYFVCFKNIYILIYQIYIFSHTDVYITLWLYSAVLKLLSLCHYSWYQFCSSSWVFNCAYKSKRHNTSYICTKY